MLELQLISEKLKSDYVVVEKDNSMIVIEKRDDSNAESNSIALLAAQMLLNVLNNSYDEARINEATMKNLLTVLTTSEDQRVKSVTIKCVYILSKMPQYFSYFTYDTLNSLENVVNCDDYLLSTYAHAAYVRVMFALAIGHGKPLKTIFIDSLSSMFVSQGSMKIGENDFVAEINDHVLDILACETKKIQKTIEDENLFLVMDEILYSSKNLTYSVKVYK